MNICKFTIGKSTESLFVPDFEQRRSARTQPKDKKITKKYYLYEERVCQKSMNFFIVPHLEKKRKTCPVTK